MYICSPSGDGWNSVPYFTTLKCETWITCSLGWKFLLQACRVQAENWRLLLIFFVVLFTFFFSSQCQRNFRRSGESKKCLWKQSISHKKVDGFFFLFIWRLSAALSVCTCVHNCIILIKIEFQSDVACVANVRDLAPLKPQEQKGRYHRE